MMGSAPQGRACGSAKLWVFSSFICPHVEWLTLQLGFREEFHCFEQRLALTCAFVSVREAAELGSFRCSFQSPVLSLTLGTRSVEVNLLQLLPE